MKKRLVVAVTGASGMLYAERFLKAVIELGHRIELIVSENAADLVKLETGLNDPHKFPELLKAKYGIAPAAGSLVQYSNKNLAAPPSSGTHLHDGMVILPCSMKTLSAVASGASRSLIERAADVALKEGRPLILATRETPLSRIHLENMLRVTDSGARVMPCDPGFYIKPREIEDLADFIAGKILNLLGVPHKLVKPWGN